MFTSTFKKRLFAIFYQKCKFLIYNIKMNITEDYWLNDHFIWNVTYVRHYTQEKRKQRNRVDTIKLNKKRRNFREIKIVKLILFFWKIQIKIKIYEFLYLFFISNVLFSSFSRDIQILNNKIDFLIFPSSVLFFNFKSTEKRRKWKKICWTFSSSSRFFDFITDHSWDLGLFIPVHTFSTLYFLKKDSPEKNFEKKTPNIFFIISDNCFFFWISPFDEYVYFDSFKILSKFAFH